MVHLVIHFQSNVLCMRLLLVCLISSTLLITSTFAANAQNASLHKQKTKSAFSLQLETTSSCTEKGAVFKIINRGVRWPKSSFLRLYKGDEKFPLAKRRLRMAKGQKVSFIVKKKQMKGERVSIWVEPTWYKRTRKLDASIVCN